MLNSSSRSASNPSKSTTISPLSNKSTPEIPKLKFDSLKDAALPAVSNISSQRNSQSNSEMLVLMRQRLIKNLTSRDEDSSKTELEHNRYANPQTERLRADKTTEPGFMYPTQSKKQYIIEKVGDLTSVNKQLQKQNKKIKQTEDIVRRNKIVKLESKPKPIQISAQDELKYLKKSTVNFLSKFFKQEFERLVSVIHLKRKKTNENKEL